MSALSPQTWPFSLDLLPQTAHLVGGSVRDALLNRQSAYLDLDFVLPERAVETARQIADRCQAGFVLLDPQRQIARVVFAQATADFAQQQGASLEADLRRRDFTVNAIAYHPHSQQTIDPLGGLSDLKAGQIRMVAPQNLADDPLRLLRAYRQSAQLGFQIEPVTEAAISELAPLLAQVAAERFRTELDILLSQTDSSEPLRQAWQAGLLKFWLPQVGAEPLDRLRAVDQAVELLRQAIPGYGTVLFGWIKTRPASVHRSWVKAARLSQLLPADPEAAEVQLTQLKYSRAELQAILAILRSQPYIDALIEGPLSLRQQYFLFQQTGESFPAVTLVAAAQGAELGLVRSLIQRYLTPDDPVAHPMPLVTGRDLMQALQLKPSRRIGQLLDAIALAQAEGQITSAAAALDWARAQK
ncbi:CCA tRNA nucleotidyltransferase [Vasconcelosia minhoensis]|nr:CCA tRNA nucleotidyltransferase [Romeria gracilis]